MPKNFLERILRRKTLETSIEEKLHSIDKLNQLCDKLEECRQMAHDFEAPTGLDFVRFQIESRTDAALDAVKKLKFKLIEEDL